tara:strand:- start:1685 stop:2479 length:795 start_codon:yes stop_codon:yes gene_type:complete
MNAEQERELRSLLRRSARVARAKRDPEYLQQLREERELRSLVRRMLVVEARAVAADVPSSSTGINALETLLKRIIPVLEDTFKSLTTDAVQRESFKKHILNGIDRLLKQVDVNLDAAGGTGDDEVEVPDENNLATELAEGFSLDALIEALEVDVDPEDDEAFIDISPEEDPDVIDDVDEFGKGVPGDGDNTGRNFAYDTFKKINQSITSAYEMLGNPEDRSMFKKYLLINVGLYFDKFDDELSTSPDYQAPEDVGLGSEEEVAL